MARGGIGVQNTKTKGRAVPTSLGKHVSQCNNGARMVQE